MHIIHLRSAWEIASSEGRFQHSRNFGRPGNLETHERVWLVCQNLPGPSRIDLNGKDIGGNLEKGPFSVDITDSLQHRNRILVSLAGQEPLGEVWLEIRQFP